MADRLDVEGRWPELFEGLDASQRRGVVQTLANGWHEGWVPNRDDVARLTDLERGAIDHAEYMRQVREAARALRDAPSAATD